MQLFFNQTLFWGFNAIGLGRSIYVKMIVNGASDPIMVQLQNNPSRILGSATYGIVRGLSANKTYQFQLAVHRGGVTSAWTELSLPCRPLIGTPDPPKLRIRPSQVQSTGLTVGVHPTFLNGAPIQTIRIYMYEIVEGCLYDEVTTEMADENRTFDISLLSTYRNETLDPLQSEEWRVFEVLYGGLDREPAVHIYSICRKQSRQYQHVK